MKNISIWLCCLIFFFTQTAFSDNSVTQISKDTLPLQHHLYVNPAGSIHIPQEVVDNLGVSIIVFHSENWEIRRRYPSGYLDIYYRDNEKEKYRSLQLSLEWRRNTYYKLAFTDQDSQLYFVGYDVIANIPSGRRLTVSRNGFDLYRFSAGESAPVRVADSISLGGIDTFLYGNSYYGSAQLCGGNRCMSIDDQNKKIIWNLGSFSAYEFVEVVFEDGKAAVILRDRFDDREQGQLNKDLARYYIAIISPQGGQIVTKIVRGVPWGIRWLDGQPIYNLADSRNGFRDVFYFDFNRMSLSGELEYGTNNLEGRVAWKQNYYLNALISVLSGHTPYLLPDDKKTIKLRIVKEIDRLVDLKLNSYPNYNVKRYSVDREPLLFGLHLGRIASMLARANSLGFYEVEDSVLQYFEEKLFSLEDTVEETVRVEETGKIFTYLKLKKGIPFWADGANVPYNFASAITDGLLAVTKKLGRGETRASSLMQPLLQEEFGTRYPLKWRYWWGLGDNGWKSNQGISLNTPDYQGNLGAIAHITYRSMDAKAVLQLQRKVGGVDSLLLEHIRKLVSVGLLLPDVNEYLSYMGSPERLKTFVARRYARSTAAWELQSQVWALHSLQE